MEWEKENMSERKRERRSVRLCVREKERKNEGESKKTYIIKERNILKEKWIKRKKERKKERKSVSDEWKEKKWKRKKIK